jgi:hypothetical protein
MFTLLFELFVTILATVGGTWLLFYFFPTSFAAWSVWVVLVLVWLILRTLGYLVTKLT